MNLGGITHVVLRWFEDLAEIADGEDGDLLVADADIEVVDRMLLSVCPTHFAQKVGLDSVTGIAGTSWGDVPYPSPLGYRLLESRGTTGEGRTAWSGVVDPDSTVAITQTTGLTDGAAQVYALIRDAS